MFYIVPHQLSSILDLLTKHLRLGAHRRGGSQLNAGPARPTTQHNHGPTGDAVEIHAKGPPPDVVLNRHLNQMQLRFMPFLGLATPISFAKTVTPEASSLHLGQQQEAQQSFDEPSAPSPSKPEFDAACELLSNRQQLPKAEIAVRKILKDLPDAPHGHYLAGMWHRMRDEPELALESFRQAQRIISAQRYQHWPELVACVRQNLKTLSAADDT